MDAVFGTGFRGAPEDRWAAAIGGLNAGAPPVVSVDIPSGVNGDTGAVDGDAVRSDLTVTFGAAKAGVVLLPGAERAGAVRVVDIGFPEDLVRADDVRDRARGCGRDDAAARDRHAQARARGCCWWSPDRAG